MHNFKKKIITLLLTGDVLSVTLAFFASYYLRNFGPFRILLEEIQPLPVYFTVLPLAIFTYILINFLFGTYKTRNELDAFNEMLLAAQTNIFWIMLIMSSSYLYKYDYSRIIILLTFLFSYVFQSIFRHTVRSYELSQYKRGVGLTNIAIIGSGSLAKEIHKNLMSSQLPGINLLGFIDSYKRGERIIGTLARLKKLIKKFNIQEIYVANPSMSKDKTLNLVSTCTNTNMRFKVATDILGPVCGKYDRFDFSQMPSLDMRSKNSNWWIGTPKSILDISVSFLAIVLLSPLILCVCVILLLQGRPVIIKQKRVGIYGKEFTIFKFRTMEKSTLLYASAPHSPNDKRITKIGKILRKYSLDEIPQLFNVLVGNMSMVGPRPELPIKVKKYKKWESMRLTAKPGITGLWQVLGRKNYPLDKNLEFDFYYVNNIKPLLDLSILVKTIPSIISTEGAF